MFFTALWVFTVILSPSNEMMVVGLVRLPTLRVAKPTPVGNTERHMGNVVRWGGYCCLDTQKMNKIKSLQPQTENAFLQLPTYCTCYMQISSKHKVHLRLMEMSLILHVFCYKPNIGCYMQSEAITKVIRISPVGTEAESLIYMC